MGEASKARDPADDSVRLRRAFATSLGFVLAIWLIKLAELWLELDLGRHGVFPRSLDGLWGILWGPLIHGSVSHAFANTAPLIVLGTLLLYGYPKAARVVLPELKLVDAAESVEDVLQVVRRVGRVADVNQVVDAPL